MDPPAAAMAKPATSNVEAWVAVRTARITMIEPRTRSETSSTIRRSKRSATNPAGTDCLAILLRALTTLTTTYPGFSSADALASPGAELFSLSAGAALLIWLVVEAAIFNSSHWVQLAYGGLAFLVVLNAFWIRRTVSARFGGEQLELHP